MVKTFTWIDYFLFALMLVLSTLVGIYYGFTKKQNTASDYLLGGKEMSIWPTATSVISSSLSGLVFLSFSADIYRYGATLFMAVPLMIVVMLVANYITLPVFYKLQVTSIYEYLNERFDNRVRVFASILYAIHQVFAIPIVIYIPALALSQATGLSVHVITPVVCGVCIFYTTLGGMKGIVWIDTIQFGIIGGTLLIAVVVGLWSLGGFGPILETASKGERLNISFELTFLKRDTFWSGLAMTTLFINHHATNQSFVQKFLSLPSYKSIKKALILSIVGIMAVKFFCMLLGLIMFTTYFNCDPLKTHRIKNYDQLVPLYIMENINYIPGFAGLFLSGIFSTSLSTLAAGMNSLAATIYRDCFTPFIRKDITQETVSLHLKMLVTFIGIFSTLSVFIVEKLGSLVPLTFSLGSVTGGPQLGLFCVGMLIPKVNSKDALYGGITSLMVMGVIILTSQWYKYIGIGRYPTLPVFTDGCNQTFINATITNTLPSVLTTNMTLEKPLAIFRISFYFYSVMGALIVIIVSLIVSYYTTEDKPLNKDCISPLMHFLLRKGEKSINMHEYKTINAALEIINKN